MCLIVLRMINWILIITLWGIGSSCCEKNDSGYFWHISDVHYDPTYWTDGISCHTDLGSVTSLGQFGHYLCDPPWTLVEDTLNEMVRRKPDPEFIVWTGDTSLHIPKGLKPLSYALTVIQEVSEAIINKFPLVPVIPSLGNNDFVPKDLAGVNFSDPYPQIANIWQRWIEDESQLTLFKKGGFFSKLVSTNLRVMALNTILYMPKNSYTQGMSDPAGQYKWMEETLSKARYNGEKVIVTGHVQPGFRTPGLKQLFQSIFLQRFMDIMSTYSDVIVASHFGHDHADGFKILQRVGDSITQTVPVYTTLSVTPRQRNSYPSYLHNPSVRLVEYDKATGRHLDYQQFYINLTESNERNETNWSLLYSFREAYGVPDMSVNSLEAIFNRMLKASILKGPTELLQTTSTVVDDPMSDYCRFIVGNADSKGCNLLDRAQIWCGMQISDQGIIEICVDRFLAAASNGGHEATNSGTQLLLQSWFKLVVGLVSLVVHIWPFNQNES